MSNANDGVVRPNDSDPSKDASLEKPGSPKRSITEMFEKLEIMALHRSCSGLDLASFNDSQRDRLLAVVEQNENHACEYWKTKQSNKRDIRLAEINASNFTHKTNRIALVVVLLALFVVTLVIIIFKVTYFVPWLTFLTGLVGGYGIAKTQPDHSKGTRSSN